MESTDNLTKLIKDSLTKAQTGKIFCEEILVKPNVRRGNNEFLFFIKPEITKKSTQIDLDKILGLMLERIRAFGFNIHNVRILSSDYLDKFNIIAQHYGVINSISSNAIQNMSDSAKEMFKESYGKSVTEVKTLGGGEFLKSYPEFNASVLDYLWQNVGNKKLAGGTYSEIIKIDDEVIYLINGFHPRQLRHFTKNGRSIVTFTLSGDGSWKDARQNFIGATNPEKANEGSLRRQLFERKSEFGLAEVSQGMNGFHLSAGPVEALIELRRYNSDFSEQSKTKEFSDFSFGKTLKNNFPAQFEKIVENSNVEVNGKPTSIFDLTEEKDSDEAISILKQYFT